MGEGMVEGQNGYEFIPKQLGGGKPLSAILGGKGEVDGPLGQVLMDLVIFTGEDIEDDIGIAIGEFL